MARDLPREVDTLIVGNGPSALILSYILHGNIPIYDRSSPHPDPILHEKIESSTNLLDFDIDHLTEHFLASRFSYSTQALPVNVLFDTLIRPYGETDEGKTTCIRWVHDSSKAVQHAVVGNTFRPGGQWVDNPVKASWDIGTLSYAGMLSLPGYGFDQYYKDIYGEHLPFYLRPSRKQVADYLAIYPSHVGINDSIHNSLMLSGGSRHQNGFYFASHNITCKHLVLASGIFSRLIPPRPLLERLPVLSVKSEVHSDHPILVIGSGFSAADVIISTPAQQKIIHIFKWTPANAPSPLRACHQQAYPEYAGVYRRMKFAALSSNTSRDRRPRPGRRRSSTFDLSRDWASNYEGLPNTEIIDARVTATGAVVTLRNDAREVFERHISRIAYVVGRRGSLKYLDPCLLAEIGVESSDADLLAGQTLRQQASEDLEISADVFIIGSLTGDSLVRFAYGSCAYAAGKIMVDDSMPAQQRNGENWSSLPRPQTPRTTQNSTGSQVLNGLDGHNSSPHVRGDAHISLDRRKDANEECSTRIEAPNTV